MILPLILCNSLLWCAALCFGVWHCALVCGTVFWCVVLCFGVWHCALVCGTVLCAFLAHGQVGRLVSAWIVRLALCKSLVGF